MNLTADDPEGQARLAAFVQMLRQLGWIEGRNLLVDIRWAAANRELNDKYVAELIALAPDAILAMTSLAVQALQRVTATVPAVFVQVADPVGAGFVDSLARPGGKSASSQHTARVLNAEDGGGLWLPTR
jgi:putative tryptophan/tyrosine transport system substrate-binding protein